MMFRRLFQWLWPVRPADPEPTEHPATKQELLDWFMTRKCCPDCGGAEFIPGPKGGLAQNVLCAGCHSEYNFAFPIAVHRIGKPRAGRTNLYGVT